MFIPDILKFLEIIAWPTVVVIGIFVIRPHLSAVLSGAKIKITMSGQTIETTLPEIKQIVEEQTSHFISPEHIEYLQALLHEGSKQYPNGIDDRKDRVFLRPLRNSGLIVTVPRNSFMQEAKVIELSALGRLFLRAK